MTRRPRSRRRGGGSSTVLESWTTPGSHSTTPREGAGLRLVFSSVSPSFSLQKFPLGLQVKVYCSSPGSVHRFAPRLSNSHPFPCGCSPASCTWCCSGTHSWEAHGKWLLDRALCTCKPRERGEKPEERPICPVCAAAFLARTAPQIQAFFSRLQHLFLLKSHPAPASLPGDAGILFRTDPFFF